MSLFHFSETPGIRRFIPRHVPGLDQPVVWAIHPDRQHNYLFPRDCPRVTFYADANSASADIARHLGPSCAVVALESAWLDRIRATTLYRYHFSESTFTCVDACAGYYHSHHAIEPLQIDRITDLLAALATAEVEIRILPNLWPLRDTIVASSLPFSMIRMRNARPRGNVDRCDTPKPG